MNDVDNYWKNMSNYLGSTQVYKQIKQKRMIIILFGSIVLIVIHMMVSQQCLGIYVNWFGIRHWSMKTS